MVYFLCNENLKLPHSDIRVIETLLYNIDGMV